MAYVQLACLQQETMHPELKFVAMSSGRTLHCIYCPAKAEELVTYVQDQMQKPDTDFAPNLVNTVCFVVNFIIQLSTFACNYQGAPFNTPIKETKGFFNMLKWSYVFCLVIIYDVMGIGTAFSLVSQADTAMSDAWLHYLAFRVACLRGYTSHSALSWF